MTRDVGDVLASLSTRSRAAITWRIARLRKRMSGAHPLVRTALPPVTSRSDEAQQAQLAQLAQQADLADRASAARSLAREAWARGDAPGYFVHTRQSLRLDPERADVWQLYAQRLVEVGRSDAAWEAGLFAVEVQPTYVAAVDLLQRIARARDVDAKVLAPVLDGLERGLPDHPEAHRGAVAILLPARRPEGVRTGAAGTAAIARRGAVLCLESKRSTKTASEDVKSASHLADPDDEAEALARFSLAKGRVSQALGVLADLPQERYPVESIRRAIRRAALRQEHVQVQRLAECYLLVQPEDGWARRVQASAVSALRAEKEAKKHPSNYQLATRGFPFITPRERAYEPREHTALYLLHNSLPYSSAGYATRSHGLLRALSKDWDVHGVTRPGFPFDLPANADLLTVPEDDSIDGVHYHRLTTAPGEFFKNPITRYVQRYTRELEEYARDQRPFVIHAASNHWNGLTAVQTARRLGIASVYEVRGLWEVTRASRNPEWGEGGMYRYIRRMEADAASGADRVLAITAGLRDEMIDRGVAPEKISLVPNGVDTTRFTPIPRDVGLARQLGIEGKTVIGYVGSVLDYEGLDLLVHAAAGLSATRDDFHVLIVGDGAELGAFTELAESLDVLGRYVTFTGRVPHAEVERYYSLIDIAPFPRLPLPVCELVSPLKPFEAMAMGKAVVSSDVRALAEIVTDGVNGLLHEKGSAQSLTSVLQVLLDSPELRARLGETARRWVVAERDWSALAGRVADVYADLKPQSTLP